MRIFYRSLQAGFLFAAASLATVPLYAQLSDQQREEIREQARENHIASINGPRQQQAVTKDVMTLSAPIVVNFTERANWDLAHPKTDFTKRLVEDEAGENGYKFIPQAIRPDAKVCPIPKATGTRSTGNDMKAANSPAPILSFNGVMGDGSEIPPDIMAAAGINYVMETTNQSYGIYNKTTGALVSNVDITTFYNASGGNGYFDPHILYDAVHGKWLAVIDGNTSTGHGGLFLAVSQTSDPTGSWWVYTVDDGIASSTLLDFPEIGYNENWVVLTANLFQGSGAITEIYVMSRASLYSGTQGTITHFSDANSFCLSPAQTMDTTTLTEWLVQNSNGNSGGTGYVQVGSITGTVAAPAYNTGSQLGVAQAWNENAVQAPQQGGGANLIDNDDTRIYSSEFINGSLWFAHTVWLPATGTATYSGVDWWQVNPASLTVQQFGRVSSSPSWYYYPAIYANSAGDALLGYSVSSTTEYASAVYAFHASADALNSMETLYNYKAGIASFAPSGFGGDFRWGDYTSVAIDPNDNSFWVAGEWANSGNLWATQIAHVGSSAPVTTPPVANFSANVTTSCTGYIQFTDLSTNTPTSWLWTFGDGGTSTVQNPSHKYLNNGTYTVTLKATNAYGNNTKTQTSYITINEPAGPAAVGGSHCGNGSISLSATTPNPVKWYDSTGTLISTNNPYVTPVLTHTTTYYVQDSIIAPGYHVGPTTNTVLGSGGYLSTTYGLNFDVMKTGVLQSVYVYAQAAGSLTITMANSTGATVGSASVNVVAGGQRVTVNLPLTIGTGYLLTYSGTAVLYRNNIGAVYPYTDADGIVSITGNNAGTVPAYYYWFYDWIVKEDDCNSQTTAVVASITSGITATAGTPTSVSCHGGTNGSATITPTGGTPAYTYSWSNGQTTATLSGVAAGNYTVSVHDANSCSGTATVSISQPNALNISVTPTNASCGSSSGSAIASVSGGTSTYSYSWSNNSTLATASNLAPATYTLTVTDAHSCTATATTTITSSGSLALNTSQVSAVCFGAATGSASVTENGGTGTITYSWSNGGSTATISGIPAGNYTVTVSDAGGCSGTSSASVSQPTAINVSVTAVNTGCGSPNGSATASASGGTAAYSYSWSNNATTASISNLSASTYTVTVTDNHQCTSTSSAVITSTGLLNVSATPSSSNCTGGSTGGASAVINGGTSPFTYSWSNGATTSSISGVSPNTYRVTATDNGGCSGTASVVVVTGTALNLNTNATSVNCFNANNGSASVSVTSGTSPYQYLWNNGNTTTSITGISAGSYYVTVTDAHNCQTIDSAIVSQPAAITIFVAAVQPTCFGLGDGSASVNATGGRPNYSYVWSNSSTAISINSLSAGGYSITLTDANSCTSSASFNITNPIPVTASATTENDSCYGNSDGSIQLIPSGGTGPYTYLWSNSSTAATLTSLAAGTYTVTITDVHNCTTTNTTIISQPSQISVATSTTDATNGQSNGSASISNVGGGNPPYVVTWSNSQNGNTITGLAAGTYTVTVTDHNGCETTASAVVNASVGIANVSEIPFTIYPNPAKTEVTVDAGSLDKETTLVLEDVLGQALITKTITTLTTLDLSTFSNGVYFIELKQSGKRAVRKFVINR